MFAIGSLELTQCFTVRPESAILRTKDARSAKLTEIRKSLAGLSLDGIFADADITALNVLLMGRMANGTSFSPSTAQYLIIS